METLREYLKMICVFNGKNEKFRYFFKISQKYNIYLSIVSYVINKLQS